MPFCALPFTCTSHSVQTFSFSFVFRMLHAYLLSHYFSRSVPLPAAACLAWKITLSCTLLIHAPASDEWAFFLLLHPFAPFCFHSYSVGGDVLFSVTIISMHYTTAHRLIDNLSLLVVPVMFWYSIIDFTCYTHHACTPHLPLNSGWSAMPPCLIFMQWKDENDIRCSWMLSHRAFNAHSLQFLYAAYAWQQLAFLSIGMRTLTATLHSLPLGTLSVWGCLMPALPARLLPFRRVGGWVLGWDAHMLRLFPYLHNTAFSSLPALLPFILLPPFHYLPFNILQSMHCASCLHLFLYFMIGFWTGLEQGGGGVSTICAVPHMATERTDRYMADHQLWLWLPTPFLCLFLSSIFTPCFT